MKGQKADFCAVAPTAGTMPPAAAAGCTRFAPVEAGSSGGRKCLVNPFMHVMNGLTRFPLSLFTIYGNHSQGNGFGIISGGKKTLLSLILVRLCEMT